MEPTPKFALDVRSIEKGDVLNESDIVGLIGLRPGHPSFQHQVASLQDWIRSELARIGNRCAVRYTKKTGSIEVLRDREASTHCNKRIRQTLSSASRYLRELKAVDPSSFSFDERRQHERAILIRSEQLEAARRAGKQAVGRLNYQRNTPGRLCLPAPNQ